MNTAIIVAAGSGTRFDSASPKQFLDLAGKPVLLHSLQSFQDSSVIDEIIVVVGNEHIDRLHSIIAGASITKLRAVVGGGASRSESVKNGFDAVDLATVVVCVHDGVRPLVTVDEIARTVKCAEENGAACLTAPVVDTIKSVEYGKIVATIDRTTLRRALTPQAFRHYVLKRALEQRFNAENATDECVLVERSGVIVTTVDGSPGNIKITHREDLIMAEAIIRGAAE
ncbi:MAG TPA: 2-C-methyl-D-erythritol 4-phosphate cytidylyltransferase [Pyrinomonadaceae bacterium]|nr:2-C-methyl-D-erythritol 4-phosphate cytidylyltransferase [Chloracidobacterium sp.]MBP9935808.1 2-C-methyl-D-erythritol 4-phosphate cytidylyltransferase [Pyrinomonadaceae bacterium]MBK9438323.1 2-C-methyl-D-erythritol 4-phosphate cytidylyltransferase [Chloracidobacterium sp.]MBK9767995.1 2-C-methyl-D-erythritol 4-phosphate cytidylyltransferase [Chloracidobacterium sp.]MBL0240792.1 2-C-methyl-D-erythritol 4-phosphate cytidylyltransferase [Chloracidobacterium sp.]